MQVNIYEAKARLSALIEQAESGEEIIIARAGKPVARLTPVGMTTDNRSGVRFGGFTEKQLNLTTDFHEPCTDDDLLGA